MSEPSSWGTSINPWLDPSASTLPRIWPISVPRYEPTECSRVCPTVRGAVVWTAFAMRASQGQGMRRLDRVLTPLAQDQACHAAAEHAQVAGLVQGRVAQVEVRQQRQVVES